MPASRDHSRAERRGSGNANPAAGEVRPVRNGRAGPVRTEPGETGLNKAGLEAAPATPLDSPITGDGIYKMLKRYAARAGIAVDGLCLHSLRATAATNALEHHADIAYVQMWLGHSSVAMTRLYDRRRSRPEDSPTFRVRY